MRDIFYSLYSEGAAISLAKGLYEQPSLQGPLKYHQGGSHPNHRGTSFQKQTLVQRSYTSRTPIDGIGIDKSHFHNGIYMPSLQHTNQLKPSKTSDINQKTQKFQQPRNKKLSSTYSIRTVTAIIQHTQAGGQQNSTINTNYQSEEMRKTS